MNGIDMTRVRPAWAEIDLDSLAWNTRQIRKITNENAAVCASVKANAYGHGAARVAAAALENGADSLSVAILDEALELRASGVGAPILILGALEQTRADEVVEHRLTQAISTPAEAQALSAAAQKLGTRASVHIKIDTGMGRLGFYYGTPSVYDDICEACSLPGIYAEGIFTHFATADEADPGYTEFQLGAFIGVCGVLSKRGLQIPVCHCSNSAAIAGFPGAHLNMVRPGISLYGGAGVLPGAHHAKLPLRRVMSLRAKVALVKVIPPGASVGYGRRFIAKKETAVATLPIGYGDGYNRALSFAGGQVLIKGRRAPIIGTICMDLCMADVTGIAGVSAGDEAVLFGKQEGGEITVEELAQKLGTIPYEIMCAAGRRIPRVYVSGGKPVEIVNYLR